jgi:phospholipid/cholesterol/gamma-HCH transport system permease protein
MAMPGERSAIGGWIWRKLDAVADLGVRPLRHMFRMFLRLVAFGLIVLGTGVTKFGKGRAVVRGAAMEQIRRAGVGLLPFVGLLSFVAGFAILGQSVVLLRQFGAEDVLGTVMVVVVFRELAPVATALVVLLRVGTGTVVELATMRATGEVEALEALSIDPVHYLVLPRVIGLAVSVFCLTVYFMIGALAGGYLFCFLEQLPLTVLDYLNQLATALVWQDFVLLVLKTGGFGAAIAVLTCYQGLSKPLRLDQVPIATTQAVTHCLLFCLGLDVVFLGFYLLGEL